MAQLTDDCFAFGGAMLTVSAAVALISERVQPVADVEMVPLGLADGRILANAVETPVAVPPFDNSAVDGYAVRHADLNASGETLLAVVARLPAGAAAVAPLAPGTAARIFTGAPMPDGADTVFMQEDVTAEDGFVRLPAGLKPGANRRFAGEDFAAGRPLLEAGTRLDPRHLAALASVGIAEVRVRRRVRVALFSTGAELVPPGAALPPGAQYDSNRFLLAALLARAGVEVRDLGILPDDGAAIAAALSAAATGADLILTSGGVSTGEEDHVKSAVEAVGQMTFWRVAIKPGRPIAMGTIRGTAIVGLPGNPVAAFITFTRLATALIRRLGGAPAGLSGGIPVESGFSYRKKAGRREYVRVRLERAEDGRMVARKFPREGAGLISSLTGSDGLIELGEDDTEISPGMMLAYLPFTGLIG